MKVFLDKRSNGSFALYINDDLQFDSEDEKVYHESLVVPGLAVVCARKASPVRALIIGGGDGLVARELFKSDRMGAVDLVDYDPQIIEFAASDLANLNHASLSDPRLNVHVRDAWEFVGDAVVAGSKYDLIISDLTVPEDIDGARFHTVQWYHKLRSLIEDRGVLCVNACSPHATPRAYWSIFNGMLQEGWHPRACHVSIPSFSRLSYGDDWGFVIASPEAIQSSEVYGNFESIPGREYLTDLPRMKQIFSLPRELMHYQAEGVPAAIGSEVLLGYFRSEQSVCTAGSAEIDSFSLDTFELKAPAADNGASILPPYLGAVLNHVNDEQPLAVPAFAEQIIDEVMQFVPILYREQAPAIASNFLADPAAFLYGLDLRALIGRLLQRASALPESLVSELEKFQDRLADGRELSVNSLPVGQSIFAILTLVIVLGNLLYPDMVYAKGHSGMHEGDHRAHSGQHHHYHGYGYYNGWGGGYYNGLYYVNPARRVSRGPIGPGPSAIPPAHLQIRNYGRSPLDDSSLPQHFDSLSQSDDRSGATGPSAPASDDDFGAAQNRQALIRTSGPTASASDTEFGAAQNRQAVAHAGGPAASASDTDFGAAQNRQASIRTSGPTASASDTEFGAAQNRQALIRTSGTAASASDTEFGAAQNRQALIRTSGTAASASDTEFGAAQNRQALIRTRNRVAAEASALSAYAEVLRLELRDIETSSDPMPYFGTKRVPKDVALARTKFLLTQAEADPARVQDRLTNVAMQSAPVEPGQSAPFDSSHSSENSDA